MRFTIGAGGNVIISNVQSAGNLVEIGNRGESVSVGACVAGRRPAIRFFDDLLHAQKAATDALFGKLEDRGFGVVDDLFGRITLLAGPYNGGVGGMDQPAQQRLVADD